MIKAKYYACHMYKMGCKLIDENNYQLAIIKLKELIPKIQIYDTDHIIESKDEVIKRYGAIFSLENINNISKEDFQSFLLFKNNHHWNGLHRQGSQICLDMSLLRKSLRYLIDESRPIDKRIDHITYEEHVQGLGKAIFSAILLVSNPEKYSVWNNPSESGLKELDIWPQFDQGTTVGQKYEIINQLQNRLSRDLKIDLWTLDTLWWINGMMNVDKSNGKIWWVNQGKNLDIEITRGYLWAPNKSKDGKVFSHWSVLKEVNIDDIIIHYANGSLRYVSRVIDEPSPLKRPDSASYEGWEDEGWQVKFEPFELNPPITLNKFNNQIYKLKMDQGPLDVKQEVKQGYMFRFSEEALKIVQESQHETMWPEYATIVDRSDKRKTWIFQANPKNYDLRSAVAQLKEINWKVSSYKEEIHSGDLVYMWESGPNAGIVAVGNIISEPTELLKDEDEKQFFKDPEIAEEINLRVRIEIIKVLKTPLLKSKLIEHPILCNLQIIKAPMGSNFKVTKEESIGLEKLIPIKNGEPQPKYTIEDFYNDTGFSQEVIRGWEHRLKRKKQIIFQGPPGTGKTFVSQRLAKILISETEGFCDLVQFHPSYAYEDFIQGIRPRSENGQIRYDLEQGRFLDFCKKADEVPNSPCVLIIDEINRANLSRVFGELMYLLEYRENEIPLSGGTKLKVPENVYIIGTMNTADRSIALVDHALRRRFSFIRLNPEYDVLKNYLTKRGFPVNSLVQVLKDVNEAIYDPNYEIGISYFMKKDDNLIASLPEIWMSEIEPYLEEFFFDQPEKAKLFRWDALSKNKLSEWVKSQ